jgi:hypothetical protein
MCSGASPTPPAVAGAVESSVQRDKKIGYIQTRRCHNVHNSRHRQIAAAATADGELALREVDFCAELL